MSVELLSRPLSRRSGANRGRLSGGRAWPPYPDDRFRPLVPGGRCPSLARARSFSLRLRGDLGRCCPSPPGPVGERSAQSWDVSPPRAHVSTTSCVSWDGRTAVPDVSMSSPSTRSPLCLRRSSVDQIRTLMTCSPSFVATSSTCPPYRLPLKRSYPVARGRL